jgi:hypothetical protein
MNLKPKTDARARIALTEMGYLSGIAADCIDRHVLYAGHVDGVEAARVEFNNECQSHYAATRAGDVAFETYMELAHSVFDEELGNKQGEDSDE